MVLDLSTWADLARWRRINSQFKEVVDSTMSRRVTSALKWSGLPMDFHNQFQHVLISGAFPLLLMFPTLCLHGLDIICFEDDVVGLSKCLWSCGFSSTTLSTCPVLKLQFTKAQTHIMIITVPDYYTSLEHFTVHLSLCSAFQNWVVEGAVTFRDPKALQAKLVNLQVDGCTEISGPGLRDMGALFAQGFTILRWPIIRPSQMAGLQRFCYSIQIPLERFLEISDESKE